MSTIQTEEQVEAARIVNEWRRAWHLWIKDGHSGGIHPNPRLALIQSVAEALTLWRQRGVDDATPTPERMPPVVEPEPEAAPLVEEVAVQEDPAPAPAPKKRAKKKAEAEASA